jgi:TPR repeat protein
MRAWASILVLFIIAFAACSNTETPEQIFADTEKKAAEGDVLASYDLGIMYEKGIDVPQDKLKAAEWYRKAAEKGLVPAQFRLGSLYYHGQGVPKDLKQAAEWYTKAAEKGYTPAQTALGNMYLTGEGVSKDSAKAAYWHKKSFKLKKNEDLTRE